MSPCLYLCSRDAEHNRCNGCYRSTEEIKTWSKMTPQQKTKVWLRLFGTTFYGFKLLYFVIMTSLAAILISILLGIMMIPKLVGWFWRKPVK